MAQHARPVGPTTNADAPFTPSMVTGAGPDRPFRFSTRQHYGTQTLSQPTHVAAPFSPEMAAGHKPLFDVRAAPFTAGGSFSPPDVLSFGIETIYGSRPSSPRIFLAPRIPLPVSQTTHVDAPLGAEMVAGWKPAFDVRSAPFSQGSAIAPPDVLVFSVEMVVGARPDRPRLFSTRSVTGQQTLSQPTHVAAPFSPEMSTGARPDRGRPFIAPRIPQPLAQTLSITVTVVPRMFFSVASVATAFGSVASSTTTWTSVASSATRVTSTASET